MKTQSILVTGFKPFLGESLNPSALLVEKISQDSEFKDQLQTLILPVAFKEAVPLVIKEIESHRPDIVIMLGQASGRAKICLERVALNWIETSSPDESAWRPPLGPIDPGGPSAYFTELPLQDWKSELKKNGLEVEISLSAGGYVCNYLYYAVLKFLNSWGTKKGQAYFIHVPYLPEQTEGKPPQTPSVPIASQYEAIRHLVRLAKNS